MEQHEANKPVTALAKVLPPRPEALTPKPRAFDRNAYQARYMRRARAQGRYLKPKA